MIDDQTAAGSHSLGDLLRRSARRTPDKPAGANCASASLTRSSAS
jgi:hypothetical protein